MASKQSIKGSTFEYKLRDIMRAHTGWQWERVPGSGGLLASQGLKGDIWCPALNPNIKYCIEAKHYKEDTINCNLLNPTVSQLEKFWSQTVREAGEVNKEPILIFRKDRGKAMVAIQDMVDIQHLYYSTTDTFIYNFEEWLATKTKEFFLNE